MSYQVGYAFIDALSQRPMTEILDDTYFKINLMLVNSEVTYSGPKISVGEKLNHVDCANWPLADAGELVPLKKMKAKCIDSSKVVFYTSSTRNMKGMHFGIEKCLNSTSNSKVCKTPQQID